MSIKKGKKIMLSIFSIVVILAIIVSMMLGSAAPLLAADIISDSETTLDYKTHLNNNLSTRYAGRVWTDKSVYTGNATFKGDLNNGAEEGVTIEKSADADFLVTYSALATSQKIIGKSKAIVDVVFVIDNSNSMDDPVDKGNDESRLDATVKAVNASIKTIMESSENSRVGVVLYGKSAKILLPLKHYQPMDDGKYISYQLSKSNTTFFASEDKKVVMDEMERGTNTHMGIDAGMNILASAENIETDGNKHVPALVLLSDGAATASGKGNWWDPSDISGDGISTSDSYSLKVAMNAQYNKQQVNNRYGITDPTAVNAMKIYTIGMGIEQLKSTWWGSDNTDYYRAQMALNPGSHIDDGNNVSKKIKGAWENYKNGRYTSLDKYEFEHPDTGDISTIAYNDGYYSAENADEVVEVFDDITNSITSIKPEAPTQIGNEGPLDSGFITYEDPLGKYMEVKDINALIYGGEVFEQVNFETIDNITTYTFSGEISSPIYGEINASNIIIEVNKQEEHLQKVIVKIPAAAIPLRINTITLNANGNVEANESNNAYPLRLLYSVGLESGINETLAGVDDDYITENTANGKVNFYSNLFTGETTSDGVTIGNAFVEFTPAATNPFYFIQEDTPLYLNADGTNQAVTFDSGATYYLPVQYYEGNEIKNVYIERLGSMFDQNYLIENSDGLFVEKGAPRLGYLADLTKEKEENQNASGTAKLYYYPTFVREKEVAGHFKIYLGNNGVAQYDALSSLTISKKVSASEGLEVPNNANFTFKVTMESKKGLTLKGILRTNGTSDEDKEIQFDNNGVSEITLTANQSLEILNVGKDVAYTIEEIDIPEGFTSNQTDNKVEGITANSNSVIEFTNNYGVEPITSTDLKLNLTGKKIIEGRDFKAGDKFEFNILASKYTPDAPLPQKDGKDVVSTIIEPTNGIETEFAFDGIITFTKPGEYRYIIREKNSNELAGIDYDNTIYRYSIKLKDNGAGKLELDGDTILEKYTENKFENVEQISFVNKYSAKDTEIAISGMKVLKVINSDYNLKDNDFNFKIEALGSNTDGSDSFVEDSTQPMPKDNEAFNIANGDVTFDKMKFDQTMIGKTYGYKVIEVLPEGVNESNPTLNGITYDVAERIIKVKVSSSSVDGEEHVVATVTPNDNNDNFKFINQYQPQEVTIGNNENEGIKIQKTFTGREWLDNDSFEYTLTSKIENNPMPEETKVIINKPGTGNVNIADFDKMTFTKAGNYEYIVKETKGDLRGVTYDQHEAKVVVNVTEDKTTGKLSAQVVYDNKTALTAADRVVTNASTFTNTYKAVFDDNTKINLDGTKELIGKALKHDQYFFEISALNGAPLGDGDGDKDGMALSPNGSNGNIKLLQNIKYDKVGTYTYLIKEQIPSSPALGVTYDESYYRVTVDVKDDLKGNLSAEVVKIEKSVDKGENYINVDEISFINKYQPLQTTSNLRLITKVLEGDRNKPLQEDEFEFEMKLLNADHKDGITLPNVTKIKNTVDGTVPFGEITFTKAGKYEIQVNEIIPTSKAPGVTYDEHVIKYKFTVIDNDGQLEVSQIEREGSSKFVNKYQTSGKIIGNQDLIVAKVLDGRNWMDTDKFNFVLEGNNETTKQAINNDKIILPDNANGVEITVNTPNNTINFGDIIFKAVGEYEFVIKEVIPQDEQKIPGILYDSTTRVVKVETKDNGDGTLSVDITDSQLNKPFINTYKTSETLLEGSANLKVIKKFTGRENNEWLDTDKFEFIIEGDSNDQATMDAIKNNEIVLKDTTITVDKEHQNANFGDIEFKKLGTYKFVVKEGQGSLPGINYDTTTKTIIVDVKDNNDGTLSAVINSKSDTLEFENTYNVDEITLDGATNLKVTKEFTGRVNNEWLESDQFAFTLELKNGEPENVAMPENAKEIIVTKDTVDKTTNFGNITFKAPGEYEFAVKEVKGTIPGVSYDDTEKTVIVNVIDNKNGTMSLAVTGNDNLVFKNVYSHGSISIDGATNLKVTKEFTGRVNDEWLESDKFSFKIELSEGVAENITMPASIVSVNSNQKTTNFGDIIFHQPGRYKFKVTEIEETIPGVVYDNSEKFITVNVIDNNEGALVVSIEDNTKTLTFNNTYVPNEAMLDGATNLKVTKEFTGRVNNEWLESDQFAFTLELKNGEPENVAMPENAKEIIVTKDTVDKTTNFGNITFKAPGEYEFAVKEVKGTIPGVSYDDTEKTVIVNVIDSEKGTLNATVDQEKSDELKFRNEYNHNSIILGGKTAIKVTKVLNGRINNEWLDTDQFIFELTPSDETLKAAENGLVVLPNNLEATATKDNRTAIFKDIEFNEPGRYTFTIQENKGELGGVTYDEAVYPVVVTVTDDQVGHLNASVLYGNNNDFSLTITNTYSTADSMASYVIEGTKILTGRNWYDEDVFTFGLSTTDEVTLNAIQNGKIIMPDTQTTVSGADKEHKYAFDEIIFKEVGEYEFTVNEKTSDIKGIISDTHSATVKITVIDNNEGQIVAAGTTSQEGSLVFENIYQPEETPIAANQAIIINKTLKGRDMRADEFRFTITPTNGESIVINGEASKDGVPVAMNSYDAITFKQEGTKSYTIKEEKGNLGGVTYDESVYHVTYKAKDNLHGSFDITRTITKDGKVVNDIHFINTYKSNPVVVGPSTEAKLAGHKDIDNRDPNASFTMKGGEFNFEIKALGNNNAPLPVNTSVQNDAKGNFVFDNIEFKQEGIYHYQILETNNGLAGVSYDAKTYDIEIEVTDDDKGQLHATVTGNKDINFTNIYDPTDVSASINGTKTLIGREMKADEFTFIFKAGDDVTTEAIKNQNVIFRDGAESLSTTNNETGTINFGDNAITFKQAGIYTFNVSEETGTNDTITYDKQVYSVIAKVTDENGALKVEWTNADKIAFTNSYRPHAGSIEVPIVRKVLDGRKLNEKEFAFTLSDTNGNILKTVKNNKKGIVDFGTITFDEIGNYIYIIEEVADNAGGVTYDKSQYYIDIEVKDIDGQLTAVSTVIYDSDRKPVDEIIFNNTYVAKSTELILSTTKKLIGRELKAGEFAFILTDENGNKISQGYNDKNGIVNFDRITYDQVGEYHYIISELKGTDDRIIYDSKQYNVIVRVTDNNKGNLEVEVDYPNGKPVFVNSYNEHVSVDTSDNSQIGLLGMLAGLSIIGMIKSKLNKNRDN